MGRGGQAEEILYGEHSRLQPVETLPASWRTALPDWWRQSRLPDPTAQEFAEYLGLGGGHVEDIEGYSGTSSWMVEAPHLPREWAQEVAYEGQPLPSSEAAARLEIRSRVQALQVMGSDPIQLKVSQNQRDIMPVSLNKRVTEALPLYLSLPHVYRLAAIEKLAPSKGKWRFTSAAARSDLDQDLYVYMDEARILGVCQVNPQ